MLAGREIENNVLLSVLDGLASGQIRNEQLLLLAIRRDSGELAGVVLRTPPAPLVISTMPDEACALAAAELVRRKLFPMTIVGPRTPMDALLLALAHTHAAQIESMADLGLFALSRVIPPAATPGTMRRANEGDLDQVAAMMEAFQHEAQPGHARRAQRDAAKLAIARGQVFLWQHDGEVVCLARVGRRLGDWAAISGVYTPPVMRRAGYASALVAALSQHLLDAGLKRTCLFTDLANATSNAIYQRVGYERIGDAREVHVTLPA